MSLGERRAVSVEKRARLSVASERSVSTNSSMLGSFLSHRLKGSIDADDEDGHKTKIDADKNRDEVDGEKF